MHKYIFIALLASRLCFAEANPELTSLIRNKLNLWKQAVEAAPATGKESWDFQQFYLQVNPYVSFNAAVLGVQIMPQFGFLWIKPTEEIPR